MAAATDLVLTEEQELLRSTAADFVAEHSPISRVRTLRDRDDEAGFSRELWKAMAELGWPGIVLPESVGGLGLGYAELAVVLEEIGKGLAPEPFLSTVLLGANCVLLGGSQAQQQAILPRVASGDLLLACALHEPGARHDPYHVQARAEVGSDGTFVLSGEKDFVFDGHVADRLIVLARTSGVPGERSGLTLFLVDPSTRGLSRSRQRLVDSRLVARVGLQDVRVAPGDVLGERDGAAEILDQVLDRASVGLSAEMLGGMSRAFELTLSYLKERRQFDNVIGSFQALKHRAARLFVEVELSRSAAMAAARAIDTESKDASLLASLAKARCSDAFVLVANEAVQMHGGIGMTDEHDIGFFLKRARVAEITFGDAAYHRDRFATLSGY
jgi:acyl-CoA dehydrogenase